MYTEIMPAIFENLAELYENAFHTENETTLVGRIPMDTSEIRIEFQEYCQSAVKFLLQRDESRLNSQLDAQNLSNATQLEIERERTKQAQLNAQAGLNKVSAGQGGNTTLYVALGIGGALVLGLVIFLVTRKKG